MRAGLQKNLFWERVSLFALSAIILFAYGWTVNALPWDFGKLIGVYVVFFFLTAQLISWLIFKQVPSIVVMTGGILIVAGGIVIERLRASLGWNGNFHRERNGALLRVHAEVCSKTS
jgi:drug/metabolite transporter (DMT)-like permease